MKVTIIGCGLVGIEAARRLRNAGHEVTGTTTRESRVAEIEPFVDRVAVLRGSDEQALQTLLDGQDVVVVCVDVPGCEHGAVDAAANEVRLRGDPRRRSGGGRREHPNGGRDREECPAHRAEST